MMDEQDWGDLPTGDLDLLFNMENSSDDQSDGLDLLHLDNISDDQSDGPRRCGCAQEGTWDEKKNVCWSILPKHVIWHPIGSGNPTFKNHTKDCYYFQETKSKKRPRRKATISEEPADTPPAIKKVKVEGGGPSSSPTMYL